MAAQRMGRFGHMHTGSILNGTITCLILLIILFTIVLRTHFTSKPPLSCLVDSNSSVNPAVDSLCWVDEHRLSKRELRARLHSEDEFFTEAPVVTNDTDLSHISIKDSLILMPEPEPEKPEGWTVKQNPTTRMPSSTSEPPTARTLYNTSLIFVILGQFASFLLFGDLLWRLFIAVSGIPLQSLNTMAIQASGQSDLSAYKRSIENLAWHIYALTGIRENKSTSLSLLHIIHLLLLVVHAIAHVLWLSYIATGSALTLCVATVFYEPVSSVRERMVQLPLTATCNVMEKDVPCSVDINILQTNVVIFLWMFYSFLALASFCLVFAAVFRYLIPPLYGRYINRFLLARRLSVESKPGRRFADQLLGPDGVYIIRSIGATGGQLLATDILEALWNGSVPAAAASSSVDLPVMNRSNQKHEVEIALMNSYEEREPSLEINESRQIYSRLPSGRDHY